MINDCTTTEQKGLSNKLHTRIFAIFFVYTVAHLYNNLCQIDELKVIETGHTTRNCFQTPLRPRHSYIIPTLTADIWRLTTKNRLRPPQSQCQGTHSSLLAEEQLIYVAN